MSDEDYDSRFSLPQLDAPPEGEAGVIVMGLDAERLLAGLGLATLADDPASVALTVDHVRHDAFAALTLPALATAGATRWIADRPLVAASGGTVTGVMSLRDAWARTLVAVRGGLPAGPGAAALSYLTACWLRRDDIDRLAATLGAHDEARQEVGS